MAFLEARIDPEISRYSRFLVEHPSRKKIYDAEGNLEGQLFGDAPLKQRVNLSHGVQTYEQFEALMDTFYVVMGTPYEGIRVKSWANFRATLTNSAVASLGGGIYQLQRKRTFGGVDFMVNITKPTTDEPLIVLDATDTPLTATVDYTTGTFTVMSGVPAKWVGEFDTPMTFQDNTWDAQIEFVVGEGLFVPQAIWMEEVPGV